MDFSSNNYNQLRCKVLTGLSVGLAAVPILSMVGDYVVPQRRGQVMEY
jgi:hypothetical protein